MLTKAADLAMGIVIPIHSHIAMNGVLSDYMPKIAPKAMGTHDALK